MFPPQMHPIIPGRISFHFYYIIIVSEQFSSCHSIFAFIIPNLLAFLQLRSSGTTLSPFELFPVTSMASLVSLVAYYLVFGVKSTFPAYAPKLEFAMSVLGSFCVATLLSLILHFPCYSVIVLLIPSLCGLLLLPKIYAYTRRYGLLPRQTTLHQLLPL